MFLIAGVSAVRLACGRYFTNTDALEGLLSCAIGSLLGSTMCTRAVTTPSIWLSVSESSCETPWMKRTRSSVGEEISPSFLNMSPRLTCLSCGRPCARSTASARTTSASSTLTLQVLPLSGVCLLAAMPLSSSADTMWLASASDCLV